VQSVLKEMSNFEFLGSVEHKQVQQCVVNAKEGLRRTIEQFNQRKATDTSKIKRLTESFLIGLDNTVDQMSKTYQWREFHRYPVYG
jgi:hypothetical protein